MQQDHLQNIPSNWSSQGFPVWKEVSLRVSWTAASAQSSSCHKTDESNLQLRRSVEYSWGQMGKQRGQREMGRRQVGLLQAAPTDPPWPSSSTPLRPTSVEGGEDRLPQARTASPKMGVPNTVIAQELPPGSSRGHQAKPHTWCSNPLSCSSRDESKNWRELRGEGSLHSCPLCARSKWKAPQGHWGRDWEYSIPLLT